MELIDRLKTKQSQKRRDYTEKEVEFLTECKKNGIKASTIFEDKEARKILKGRTSQAVRIKMENIKI
jgi:hypothetical protein